MNLELPPRYRKYFIKGRFEASNCLFELEKNHAISNSELYNHLCVFKTELILYMMAATNTKKVKQAISHFYTKLRHVKTSISGKDLIEMGVEPGPIYREIYDAVLNAKLNGRLIRREDELAFAREYVSNRAVEPQQHMEKPAKLGTKTY